jgi:hypothetical protein
MKKYIIVVVLLAVIIGGGFWEKDHIEKTFDEFGVRLEQIAAKTKAETVTKAEADALIAWWEGRKFGLDLIVPHVQMTEADMRLAEMAGNIEIEKYPEAYAQVSILISLAKRVKQLLGS